MLRMEVSDARRDRGLPAPAELGAAPLDSEGGRGLLLVDALAADWGIDRSDPVLKTVWCSIALDARPFSPVECRRHVV